MSDTHTIPIEALLEQGAWLRRAARDLVRDGGEAEDLVQETWLAALRRPPGADRPARPWLATVLRNAGRQRARRAGRLQARETAVAQRSGEATESTDDLAARAELCERIAALVRALPAPERDVVVLHYVEGHRLAEVARRLGLPPGTVRWRHGQALERLRGKLDADHHGDRGTWVRALAPLAAGPIRLATIAGLPLWLAAGLMALTVASTAAMLATGTVQGDDPELPMPSAHALVATDTASTSTALLAAGGGVAARRPIGDEVAAVSATTRPAIVAGGPSSSSLTVAHLRVVDQRDRPIAGATVEARATLLSIDPASLEPAARAEFERLNAGHRATTDAAGEATLTSTLIQRPTEVRIVARNGDAAFGSIEATLEPGVEVDLGSIVVEPGVPIRGSVVGLGEAGAAGVTVVLTAVTADGAEDRAVERRVELDRADQLSGAGAFELWAPPLALVQVWARRGTGTWGCSPTIGVGEVGLAIEQVVVALPEPGADLGWRFQVVDGAGEPIEAAEVRIEIDGVAWTTSVDTEGRVDFVQVPRERPATSVRVTEVRGEFASIEWTGLAASADLRRVVMEPLARQPLTIRLSDPEGAPVSGEVSVGLPGAIGLAGVSKVEGTQTIEIPGDDWGPMMLRIRAFGYATQNVGEVLASDIANPLEVVLEPLPIVRGRVLDQGEPVEGVRVDLRAATDPGWLTLDAGFPLLYPIESSAMTDEQGRFVLVPEAPGDFVVQAVPAGRPPVARRLDGLEERWKVEGLDLHLESGATLEGRVVDETGQALRGVVVGVARADFGGWTGRTDRDGRYRIEGLPAGAYAVVVLDREPGRSSSTWPTTTELATPELQLESGERRILDLRAPSRRQREVRGVVSVAGWPSSALSVSMAADREAYPYGDYWSNRAQVDVDGTFELVAPRAGVFKVTVSSADGALGLTRSLRIDTEPRGDLELFVEPVAARLDVVAAEDARGLRLFGDAGGGWSWRLSTTAQQIVASGGSLSFAALPGSALLESWVDGESTEREVAIAEDGSTVIVAN
ncbi:sigma-70 family RNA polymerase sigma factor [Engelhardtia mirabilis]|uniref:ECF RNA polymerase sigma factor SigL n=1 Tax=Engelhardtia mirabilis TaxID=2528011 RepID=A0A518BEY2_9BACT|nr:ECF RNA polymerase sigma factor SigL [Planctomycetes bacterium Pla133]QDU99873.1 ECF RNA polymerase sigma factor SigL [Planctomycetes bacterium Pla86]